MSWNDRSIAKFLIKGTANPSANAVNARRKQLFSALSGTVLEIGPGAGANLRYLSKDVRWIGVEPNPHLISALKEEAQRRGMRNAKVFQGGAEQLPVLDKSVDTVITTQVFCSVSDSAKALMEIKRVLKAKGKLIYIEHILAKRGWLRVFQKMITPFWKRIAGGCRMNLDTLSDIQRAGFTILSNESFDQKYKVRWPHIAGIAVKE